MKILKKHYKNYVYYEDGFPYKGKAFKHIDLYEGGKAIILTKETELHCYVTFGEEPP
jgi:hypothetical protein